MINNSLNKENDINRKEFQPFIYLFFFLKNPIIVFIIRFL